jgi:hypothetical protein
VRTVTHSVVGLLANKLVAPPNASAQLTQLARQLLITLGAVRILVGVVAFAAPKLPALPWVGREAARTPTARLLARALGGRDLALGLGAVVSANDPAALARWASAGAIADAGDVAATLLAYRHLPHRSRFIVLISAGGAAILAKLGVVALAEGLAGA